jgi:hypothetical protein
MCYSIQYTVHSVQCTVYSVQCTVYSIHYTVQFSILLTSVSSLKGLEYSALTGTLDSFRFLISCIAPPDGTSAAPYIRIIRSVIMSVVFDFVL